MLTTHRQDPTSLPIVQQDAILETGMIEEGRVLAEKRESVGALKNGLRASLCTARFGRSAIDQPWCSL
jgi:hypothetical protein